MLHAMMKPLYVKDTNDFVLYHRWDTWCIARDLSMLNVEMCINKRPLCLYKCPNYQDKDPRTPCAKGNWKTPYGKFHIDESFRIDCV